MICNRLILDLDMLVWTFGKFPTVMWVWSVMKLSTMLIVYPAFHYWATSRIPGPVCKLHVVYFVVIMSTL